MNKNIAGKVVVITGASSGLGESAARYLAARGAKVVLAARRAERIEALAEEIRIAGGEALAVVTDVAHFEQTEALMKVTYDTFGRIDVVLNNAGLMPLSPLEARRVDEWHQMIDVNIKGVLHGIGSALPYMKAQRSGHIINVSSVAGHVVGAGTAVYAGTKFAVRAISEGLRQEVKPYNIRTTIVSPGAVDTELRHSVKDEAMNAGIGAFYDDVAISAVSFARVVAFAIAQSEEVDINEVLFRPTKQLL